MNISTQEFLKKFPQAKLNDENKKINEILVTFIEKYHSKFDRSWQTVGGLMKNHFTEHGVTFPKCNDMKPEFWEIRGWENYLEKVNEQHKPFPTTTIYWLNKGFSEDEAKEKATSFYKEKLKGKKILPTQLQYYLNKGMTEEDAKIALSNEQKKRTKKLKDKEAVNPELKKQRLWTHIEYWTSRGFSEEEGYQKMKETEESKQYQTMEKLIKKYQSNGLTFDDATEKAKNDYKKRAKKTMDTRIKNDSFGFQKASKQSLKVFQPLMEKLDEEGIEYYVGIEGNSEFFLASGTEYFFSYDFCIPSKKLIIEFHGEHIHPNPKMSQEEWKNWKHCWNKKTADECRAEDLKKIELAESKGYKVFEIFESDDLDILEFISGENVL